MVCLHVHGCRWSIQVWQRLRNYAVSAENSFFLPSSHQLPITPHLSLHKLPPQCVGILAGLILYRSCATSHSLCGFTCATALFCYQCLEPGALTVLLPFSLVRFLNLAGKKHEMAYPSSVNLWCTARRCLLRFILDSHLYKWTSCSGVLKANCLCFFLPTCLLWVFFPKISCFFLITKSTLWQW